MPKLFPAHFGFKTPVIIQAPMAGGISTPHLVAAISNAFGLGSYSTGYLSHEQVDTDLKMIKSLTSRPFAANLFIPPVKTALDIKKINAYQLAINRYKLSLGMREPDTDLSVLRQTDDFNKIVETLLAHQVPIVSFTFGNLPEDIIKQFKKNGTYLIGTATSVEEAKILAASNIDAIVAQGMEAGGHRGGFFTDPKSALTSTMELVNQIAKQLNSHPIIAAGGIMDGQDIVSALASGAVAVQMGTAFLTTHESGASEAYKKALLRCRGLRFDPTRLTTAFSGKLARGFENQLMREIKDEDVPEYPIPHLISASMRKEAGKQGKSQFMSLWCGQGVVKIRDEQSATHLLNQLREEIERCLHQSSEKDSLIQPDKK